MLEDLDKTIETLVKETLPKELKSQITITFATPDSNFPPNGVELPAINFFLYDVRENLDYRKGSQPWVYQKPTEQKTLDLARPPVMVESSYLVTAWSSGESTSVQDEHYLLGEVIKLLFRYPSIPAEYLQNSLKEIAFLPQTLTLQASRLQSLGEFWTAMGGKPKVMFNYSVTVPYNVHEPFQEVPLIKEPPVVRSAKL